MQQPAAWQHPHPLGYEERRKEVEEGMEPQKSAPFIIHYHLGTESAPAAREAAHKDDLSAEEVAEISRRMDEVEGELRSLLREEQEDEEKIAKQVSEALAIAEQLRNGVEALTGSLKQLSSKRQQEHDTGASSKTQPLPAPPNGIILDGVFYPDVLPSFAPPSLAPPMLPPRAVSLPPAAEPPLRQHLPPLSYGLRLWLDRVTSDKPFGGVEMPADRHPAGVEERRFHQPPGPMLYRRATP
ncbi:hypothetical protein GUITHDRAFT_146020 [Guillardia theta CCMP2712]|uniref:Uncharacterized protein n=1 Tax=Guillardia theta (strain CCMP2712) TaxID=905079 RepID=L1IIJ6_GUITC|nr:hypothetical protein GUITHDRAFT_146020 [Guillardia theta CCMP2712]EKX36078.1 hypothetical protein GUITHDRAFT_146020 [Guillardia theta CCMP2712]|eukprot:XP_005823058.1 hypothetical protein GUITHDRAFT_146020 [Guillardia theta CCMP2712]